MLALLLVLLLFYVVAVFVSTIPYWYETPNNPSKDIPASKPGLKSMLRLWWEAARAVGWIILAHPLHLMLPWLKHETEPELPEREYPPLLLVHGLYHNATGWVFLRRHLQHVGFLRIHSYSYCSCKTNITLLTNRLELEISNLEKLYPGEKPILVGHSLGGLLIRNWFAEDPLNQSRARGVLTLGAPHKGSKMAVFACGELGKSLLPSNPFFAELARTEPKASIPCLSLGSEADTMVLPQDNLLPVTPGWEFRLTPYCTHVGLITSPAVARMIAWELHRMSVGSESPQASAEPAPAPVEAKKQADAILDEAPAADTTPSETAEAADVPPIAEDAPALPREQEEKQPVSRIEFKKVKKADRKK